MGFFENVLNFFFPPCCASCRTEGDFLCKNCVQYFHLSPLRNKSKHASRSEFRQLDGVIYAADYAKNPQLQAAIFQFKYKFTKPLTAYFSALMAGKLLELGMIGRKEVVLIPVPLHPKRKNYRGFNQAELLSEGVLRYYAGQISVAKPLVRVRHTSQQAKLSKKERHQNLKEAFIAISDFQFFPEKIYFLVDDVCTTGSTLDECARVLKEAGLKKVYGLVIARAFK